MAERGRPGQTAIYALSDCDGVIRYVGKANNPHKRWLQHKADRNRAHRPLYHWLRREVEAGRSVKFSVLEWVSLSDWEDAERRLIALHRTTGKLLNLAIGGAGGSPDRKPAVLSEAAKRARNAKIMFSHTWKTLPEEARDRIRARILERAKVWARECPEIAAYIKDLGVGLPA